MENQQEKSSSLNANNLTLLIGAIFGALISYTASGTLMSIVGGVIGGLIFAALFNKFILPEKPSDR